MAWVGDVKIPFPHHGGTIPKVLWIVAHSLECEATPGLAVGLAKGYFQNESVSVHGVSDPSTNVAGLDTSSQGWHAGATANLYGLADEVTGRAAWSRATWLSGNPRKALERSWIELAGLGVAAGLRPEEFRWLSVAEVKAKKVRGYCYHYDLTRAFSESTHTDPGEGYPADIAMTTIRWYAGVADYWGLDSATRPDGAPQGNGQGGAEAEFDLLRWISDPSYK